MNQYWYNGELIIGEEIKLSLNDSGFLYGATVFTTLRVYQYNLDHPLTLWDSHLERLNHSINKFNWVMPDWVKIKRGATILKQQYPVLRITIFPDGRELILGRKLPENLTENQQNGVIAWLSNDLFLQRSLPLDKTGNYLGAWLALQKALKMGAKEAILQNNQNHWLETATGNLWGYGEGFWHTPPLKGILPGIMRNYLLTTLKNHGIKVKISAFTPELITQLETLFYSNSVVQIMPIKQVLINDNIREFKINHSALNQLLFYCF